MNVDVILNLIDLKTRKIFVQSVGVKIQTRAEVLNWYLQLNTGGVLHTQEELDRVRILLDKEIVK